MPAKAGGLSACRGRGPGFWPLFGFRAAAAHAFYDNMVTAARALA